MNTKLLTTFALAAALGPLGATPAAAHCGKCGMETTTAQAAHSQHDSMAGHDVKTAAGDRHGTKFLEKKVEGYTFEYYLIEIKPMAGMQMKSHHLMTYLTAADGKAVVDAKVGYLVVGAGGAEQKVMAMAMADGYGADVDLRAAGPDKVTVKVVAGAKTLIDEFTYPVPKK